MKAAMTKPPIVPPTMRIVLVLLPVDVWDCEASAAEVLVPEAEAVPETTVGEAASLEVRLGKSDVAAAEVVGSRVGSC